MPPLSSSNVSTTTSRADERVLRVLAEQGIDQPSRDSLLRMWQSQRYGDELFAHFLVRHEILDDGAPPLLAMNWGDNLLISGRDDLFRKDGIEKLRSMLAVTP